MNDKKKCCGTCKYHCFEDIGNGYICVNDKSEYVADYREYEDYCNEYEGRR